MKHFPRFGWLAIVLGCSLSTPVVWASGDTLLEDMPQEFMHSAQGYLGVDLREIDANRVSALKLKDAHGAEISTVDHDAPAGKAGLRVHDVILQMNGQQVEGVEQLRHMLRETPPGTTVTLVISRDGDQMNVTLQLADRELLQQQAWAGHFSVPEPDEPAPVESGQTASPPSRGGSSFLGTLIPRAMYVGADVNPVKAQLAGYFGVKNGLLVESVDEQSPAAQAGLKAGDVILKVNSMPMVNRNDWLKAIRNNLGKQVQLTIMRDKQEQTLTMTAGEPQKSGDLQPPLSLVPLMDMPAMDLSPMDRQEIQAQIAASREMMAQMRPLLEQMREQMREQMKALDSPEWRKQLDDNAREIRRQMEMLRKQLDPLHGMD